MSLSAINTAFDSQRQIVSQLQETVLPLFQPVLERQQEQDQLQQRLMEDKENLRKLEQLMHPLLKSVETLHAQLHEPPRQRQRLADQSSQRQQLQKDKDQITDVHKQELPLFASILMLQKQMQSEQEQERFLWQQVSLQHQQLALQILLQRRRQSYQRCHLEDQRRQLELQLGQDLPLLAQIQYQRQAQQELDSLQQKQLIELRQEAERQPQHVKTLQIEIYQRQMGLIVKQLQQQLNLHNQQEKQLEQMEWQLLTTSTTQTKFDPVVIAQTEWRLAHETTAQTGEAAAAVEQTSTLTEAVLTLDPSDISFVSDYP